MKDIHCAFSDSDRGKALAAKKAIDACLFLIFLAYTAFVILGYFLQKKEHAVFYSSTSFSNFLLWIPFS